jgi:hydroxymethylglutaryl-CoA lyase
MSDLPNFVSITEEGPREGSQFEKGPIATDQKIRLVDALSDTGLAHIQVTSFVNPKTVPGAADAAALVAGIKQSPGVKYTGLWLNARGFERAAETGRLSLTGSITLCASEAFLRRNQNRSLADNIVAQHEIIPLYQSRGVKTTRGSVMAAFGCNFEGRIATERVLRTVDQIFAIAAAHGETLDNLSLADTMAWASPKDITRVVGAVRDRYPDINITLHLHDTRGMAVANAYAGLQMGVARFDASVGGLGGCPFAGHRGAAGNIATEALVFLCHQLGIETGIDLESLLEAGVIAEDVVGHPLPSALLKGGNLLQHHG